MSLETRISRAQSGIAGTVIHEIHIDALNAVDDETWRTAVFNTKANLHAKGLVVARDCLAIPVFHTAAEAQWVRLEYCRRRFLADPATRAKAMTENPDFVAECEANPRRPPSRTKELA